MPNIKINNLNLIIERLRALMKNCPDEIDEPLTMSKLAELAVIDRKTLRKWLKSGVINADIGYTFTYKWENGKLLRIPGKPNGIYQMTILDLYNDLICYQQQMNKMRRG